MEFLHADQVESEPGERIFRHGRLGPLVLFGIFGAPLCVALFVAGVMLSSSGSVPWYAWLVLGPVLLVLGLIFLVVIFTLAQAAWRSFLPSNWVMRVSPAGLVLNLRSFQNSHFPQDGPTVVRFPWPEVACAREARDVTRQKSSDESHWQTRWLQIELVRTDTNALEALIRAERERRGPRTKRLGITSSGRSNHVPVFVASPGVLRTDWLGRGMLRALEKHVSLAERQDFGGVDLQPDVGARLAELVRRGDTFAAIALARRGLGLSLSEAHQRVRSLEREAG